MTLITENSAGILHIRPPRCARSDAVDGWLADAGLSAVRLGDVYRGLATLAGSPPIRAVLVSVDTLDGLELEFFKLASRIRPAIQLLVYGREGSESKIEQALLSGASARATVFGIRALASRLGEHEATSVRAEPIPPRADQLEVPSPKSIPEREPHGAGIPPVSSTPVEGHAPPHDASVLRANETDLVREEEHEDARMASGAHDGERFDADETDDSLPPRFPWTRPSTPDGREGPPRTPPVRDGNLPPRLHPVPVPRAIDDTPRGSSEERESLLTPEELAALLGDEFAAFQPLMPRREGGVP